MRPGEFSRAAARRGPEALALLGPAPQYRQSDHWNTSQDAVRNHEERMQAYVDAAVVVDAGVFLSETLAGWGSVSGDVMQAVSHLTHEDVNTFTDLYTTVHEHGYNLASDGFFYGLRGHIGEWQAIRDFAAFQPAVPYSATNQGWDLQFGEHGFTNVKVVGDASSGLASHLSAHPDVSVILNADALHIPPDALTFNPGAHFDPSVFANGHTVVVDSMLSAAQTGAEAHNAIQHLENPIQFHFPWITMIVAGVVESGLVVKGKTTIQRAAKNIAVTTTAVTSGGLAGHVIGGALQPRL